HPTDLALSPDGTQLYASSEGQEAVARFSLDFGTAVPLSLESGRLGTAEPVQRLAAVLPLGQAGLAPVAIFLTVTRMEGTPAAEAGGEGGVALPAGPAALRATAAGPGAATPAGGTAEEAAGGPAAGPTPSAGSAADSLTIGVDEALERSGAGPRQGLQEGERPLAPPTPPEEAREEALLRWLPDRETVG